MIQNKTIILLRNTIETVKGIQVALLYGSLGRNEGTPNSDIDIQILVDETYKTQDLLFTLKEEFKNNIRYTSEVTLRNKVVVYFYTQPKVEFSICKNINEINRNYLGSEIIDINKTILFANDDWKDKIYTYLQAITDNKKKENDVNSVNHIVSELIDKFIYEFENSSTMHRRSDGFQFYFFFNIALHVAIQLKYISNGKIKYYFLPKQFMTNELNDKEKDLFIDTHGVLFLPLANQKKRKLLNFFYSSVKILINKERFDEIKEFCEWIYERDFFWNLRDINRFNPRIKKGVVYRSATMTLFQNDNHFDDLLKDKNVKTIIDLRADREIENDSYTNEAKCKFNYIRAAFDPWNQPDWFKENFHYGTGEEIAYRFFGIGCQKEIKLALETILNEKNGAVLIHCFAGKDRTGILVLLLHLLVETPLENIYSDYLASEMDIKPYRLKMMLDIVNEQGGIIPYLLNCGLESMQINQLKKKLLN